MRHFTTQFMSHSLLPYFFFTSFFFSQYIHHNYLTHTSILFKSVRSPNPIVIKGELHSFLYILLGKEADTWQMVHTPLRQLTKMCGSLELFNPSKKMTRRGRHVQRGWYPLILQTAYPHRSLSYTHTQFGLHE